MIGLLAKKGKRMKIWKGENREGGGGGRLVFLSSCLRCFSRSVFFTRSSENSISGSLPGPVFTVEVRPEWKSTAATVYNVKVAGEKLGRAPILSRKLQKHFSFLPQPSSTNQIGSGSWLLETPCLYCIKCEMASHAYVEIVNCPSIGDSCFVIWISEKYSTAIY